MPEVESEFPSSLPLYRVAYRSWASIHPWVMAWLWYLNVLYWCAAFFLPREEAIWALTSYLAVGPLIVLMVVRQRGLTRLSGLIHLPWVPFSIYLGCVLYGRAGAVQEGDDPMFHAWRHLLFWSTSLCLALDVVDVLRWLAGDRYVLGTQAASAAGASRLARMD